MQKNRLGATVSTKQMKIQSNFLSSRYWSKHAEIWRFGLDTEISALFGQYLEHRKLEFLFASLKPWRQAGCFGYDKPHLCWNLISLCFQLRSYPVYHLIFRSNSNPCSKAIKPWYSYPYNLNINVMIVCPP